MSQLGLLKTFSNETKRKNNFFLVQESELGIEAAEKKACWDLANIWFGNRRRKSSQIVYDDICLLVPLVTILFAQPIGAERLGGIKKTKGTLQ
jgi:hypothetical protein